MSSPPARSEEEEEYTPDNRSRLILALLVRYCGPGWTAISHAFRSTDRDLVEAAELDGASRWQMLHHVQWPQISPQIGGFWYVLLTVLIIPDSIFKQPGSAVAAARTQMEVFSRV